MADKPLYLDPTIGIHVQKEALVSSLGAANAGRVIATGADGLVDVSFMPPGIGPAMEPVQASEALAAGALVNFWTSGGVAKARNADASAGKPADGYTPVAVASGATANVYRSGRNTGVTGLTVGDQFLSATTAGASTSTPPTGSGQLVQRVGYATGATTLSFSRGQPTQLA